MKKDDKHFNPFTDLKKMGKARKWSQELFAFSLVVPPSEVICLSLEFQTTVFGSLLWETCIYSCCYQILFTRFFMSKYILYCSLVFLFFNSKIFVFLCMLYFEKQDIYIFFLLFFFFFFSHCVCYYIYTRLFFNVYSLYTPLCRYFMLKMQYLSKHSLIKHTCSWHDKHIVLWMLNRQVKIFLWKLTLKFSLFWLNWKLN